MVDQVYDGQFRPRKLGVRAGTYAFPQALLQGVERALKARNQDYAIEQFNQSARDFASQLMAFSRQNVDAIMIIGSFFCRRTYDCFGGVLPWCRMRRLGQRDSDRLFPV
jgi:hypothetical protein